MNQDLRGSTVRRSGWFPELDLYPTLRGTPLEGYTQLYHGVAAASARFPTLSDGDLPLMRVSDSLKCSAITC